MYRVVEIGTFSDSWGTGDRARISAYQIRRDWTEDEMSKRRLSSEVIVLGALVDTVRVLEIAEVYVVTKNAEIMQEV